MISYRTIPYQQSWTHGNPLFQSDSRQTVQFYILLASLCHHTHWPQLVLKQMKRGEKISDYFNFFWCGPLWYKMILHEHVRKTNWLCHLKRNPQQSWRNSALDSGWEVVLVLVYFTTVLLGLWGLSVVLGYRMMQRLKAEQRIHLQTEKKWNVSLHTFQRAKRPRLVFEHRMGFSERRIGNFSSSPTRVC